MPIDLNKARTLLQAFDFHALFIEELGWDNPPAPITITLNGQPITLQAIAQKRGMVAYHLPTLTETTLPDHQTRRKIERQVTKASYEHLIIFTDPAQTAQIWQWVRREPGKPSACREHHFHKHQSGDALIQKLQSIAFSLEEEEETLTLFDVTRGMRVGFDVEKVTKRFYDQFKKEHGIFLKLINGITEKADLEWYASVMLNRLMFIYFIQKKGFLNGDRDYLGNRLVKTAHDHGKDKFYSFYRYFLLRLFHEGLGGRQRTPELEKLLGKIIPFLNGGLFEKHEIEKRNPDIQIPDKAFERLFDYFDEYQWHLDERPLRDDKEINPDVLGYIFEKYVNQKQMGAYYTKEDITEYISKSSIIPFLFDAARPKCKVAFENLDGPTIWDHLKVDPDRYIYPSVRHGADNPLPLEIEAGVDVTKPNLIERRKGWNKPATEEYALPTENWREVAIRRKRYEEVRTKLVNGEVRDINDLITLNLDMRQFAQDVIQYCEGPELLRAFWHSIENVTVLDPACGSGAFLFAALNILEPLYEAVLDRMEGFLGDELAKLEKDKLKSTQHGFLLLPHGKMDDFSKLLDRVAAHPNRRYFIFKSIILNNLYGVDIMEEAVEICKLRLFLKLAAQVEPDTAKPNYGIEPLPDIDFNIRGGNTLVGFTSMDEIRRAMATDLIKKLELPAIEEKAEDVDRAFQLFHEMQTDEGMEDKEFVSAKKTLRVKLKALNDELDRYLATEYDVDPVKKEFFDKWRRSHQPFHWLVDFYGIINQGGFDVIIGNPPYVEYKEINKTYKLKWYVTEECGNLYAFFWERSLTLTINKGRIGLIIPVASVCTDGYKILRKLWRKSGNMVVSSFNDRPGKLFNGLEHIRLSVTLLNKDSEARHTIHSTSYNKWLSEAREELFHLLRYVDATEIVRADSIAKIGSPIEASIIKKVSSSPKTLESYAIKTGHNHIYYTRKLSWFVQILDFIPTITDKNGKKRDPSELKEVIVSSQLQRDSFLCALNSTLFYWLLTVSSDCRNLNKREVLGISFNFDVLGNDLRDKLSQLAKALMKDYKKNSKSISMNYKDWGLLKIQCIYPKHSKHILDEIDLILSRHYGFTEEELDFIINYDIKYRMGRETEAEEE